MNFLSLTVLIFLPLVGALLVAATPSKAVGLQRGITLLTMFATGVIGIMLCLDFNGASAAAQHVEQRPWFTLPGGIPVAYKLGLDGLSVLMVALTALLGPIVMLSTWGHIHERVKEFMVWLLVMQTGMLGVFLSLDLVLFYTFWEVSLVPLYFILGIWGGSNRLYATIKFFLYTVFGSLVMLIAVIWLMYRFGTTDIVQLTNVAANLPGDVQLWLFAAFALAFSIKVPLMPFHTWLADAHTEAPTSGSVILAGVLLKMGTYGLLRFCIAMFPAAAIEAAPLMMALGAIGIVYGAFLAMAQTDIKRLVACSSVSHLGYVVLGLFAMTAAGLRGGLLQMVNHGLSTGMLFLLIGMIYERRHTRALDQYGGIASVMPVYALFFVIAVLSSVGLPGLNGFVGEYLVLLGTYERAPILAAIAVTGVIFGAVYLLMATRKLLFGPLVLQANKTLTDLRAREVVLMLPIVVLMVWMGVAPNTFLARTEGSLVDLTQRLDRARAVRTAELIRENETRPTVADAEESQNR
ncbi:MAG: NADH-quinone oxidoreductase subunit M [Planctomycetes bacterium]|nr:NADH-quinone oxidoreductase subunit M [Planctomycetota bacterium]